MVGERAEATMERTGQAVSLETWNCSIPTIARRSISGVFRSWSSQCHGIDWYPYSYSGTRALVRTAYAARESESKEIANKDLGERVPAALGV